MSKEEEIKKVLSNPKSMFPLH